jgi:hypothetical protein
LTDASADGRAAASVAGLRHVGTAATLAADLPGDEIHQITGLQLAGVIRRDPGDQADLAVAGAGSTAGLRS